VTVSLIQTKAATPSGTSCVVTLTSAVAAGDLLTYQAAETFSIAGAVTSITDTSGNTWTKIRSFNNSNGYGELWATLGGAFAASSLTVTIVFGAVLSAQDSSAAIYVIAASRDSGGAPNGWAIENAVTSGSITVAKAPSAGFYVSVTPSGTATGWTNIGTSFYGDKLYFEALSIGTYTPNDRPVASILANIYPSTVRTMAVTSGVFSESAFASTFNINLNPPAPLVYAVAAPVAALVVAGPTITAAPGTFTLGSLLVGLNITMPVSAGAFASAIQNPSFNGLTYFLQVSPFSYALTLGTPVLSQVLNASLTAYAATTYNAAFVVQSQYNLATDVGAISITAFPDTITEQVIEVASLYQPHVFGLAATFALTEPVNAGVFAETPPPASIVAAQTLVVPVDTYALVGPAPTLSALRGFVAPLATYNLSGPAVSPQITVPFPVPVATYSFTGQPETLVANYVLQAGVAPVGVNFRQPNQYVTYTFKSSGIYIPIMGEQRVIAVC
jgi:hypothetical protein